MALGTLNPFSTYPDSVHCFLPTRARYQIECRSGGPLPSQVSSVLSLRHANHTGCLRVARRPTVVCLHNSKSAAAPVTQKSWDKLVLKNESTVLVEFYASWCGPCRMVHRVIDEIAAEYRGKLECYVLNTDLDLPLAEEYDVKAVPVVLLFKNGRKHDCIVGTMPKEFYVAAIEKVLVS